MRRRRAAFLREWNRWLPDFFVDDHVTDGADYQYDMTFSIATDGPASGWVRKTLEPELFRAGYGLRARR